MSVVTFAPRVEGLPFYGGVDAGGTKFLCAVGRTHSSIDRIQSIRTRGQEETLTAVADFFNGWLQSGHSLSGIGISSFGPLNRNFDEVDYGKLRNSPKPGWQTADIVGYLRQKVSTPIDIDTDVNGAALAEGRWGAACAEEIKHYAYVTVGTGIGVGVVNNGELVSGTAHLELGHYEPPRAPQDKFAGICPYHPNGCLEGLACGPAIQKRNAKRGEDLADDDPVWPIIAFYLGHLCSVLLYGFSCQKIIFGGGVMNRAILFPLIRKETARRLGGYLSHPSYTPRGLDQVIVPSGLVIPQLQGLAANAGVLGGFILAEQALTRRKSRR